MKAKSLIYRVFGLLIFFAGGIAFGINRKSIYRDVGDSIPTGVWWSLLYAALISIGWILLTIGRKLNQKNAEKLIDSSTKQPILYLRPFDSDDDPSYKLNLDGTMSGGSTDELDIVRATTKLGPLIAIGNPNDDLPTLGAGRTYVDNDTWQDKVVQYIDKSQLIILRIGFSEGVIWELSKLFSQSDLSKLILLIPFKDDYKNTRQEMWDLFTQKLKYSLGNLVPTLPAKIGESSLIYFDLQRQAILQPKNKSIGNSSLLKILLKMPDGHFSLYYDLRSLFNDTGKLKFNQSVETLFYTLLIIFIFSALIYVLIIFLR
jgi:hypothetical protein